MSTDENEGLAIIGYDAHLEVLKKEFPESVPVPWEKLPRKVRKAWIAAADAIVDAYSRAVLN